MKCATFFFLLILIVLSGCDGDHRKADLVFRDGQIFTANAEQPMAEAIAILGDRILAVGRNADMERYTGDATEVVDLHGLFGCPGFNDAHLDLVNQTHRADEIDLLDAHSFRDLRTAIDRAIDRLPPSSWVVGHGWNETLFSEEEMPNHRVLDRVAWTVPVFLVRVCGHVAVVNRMALRIAGIDENTPDPPGGQIMRNPDGSPTGVLKETAMRLVSQFIPDQTTEDFLREMKETLVHYRRLGITSAQVSVESEWASIFSTIVDEGGLSCRLTLNFPLNSDNWAEWQRLREQYSGSLLRFGYLSLSVDGSLDCRTALLFQPYLNDASNLGLAMLSQEALNSLVLRADRAGFQIGLHAAGDAANRMALEAFALSRRLNGIRDSRHRVEQALLLTANDIPQFGLLGVIASVQPVELLHDMTRCEVILGASRCRQAHAWGSVAESGGVLAFGTSSTVDNPNPLLGIYAAVTRRDTLGLPPQGWHTEERLSVEEAIRAFTLGSAWAEFQDEVKGSIEPGKLADLVFLDRNLLKVQSSEIREARVVRTVLGGRIIYEEDQ